MRNALALHLVLLVALLGSCSRQLITSRVLTTQPDDNAEEARTQEESVPPSMAWAGRPSPEAAVNQRRAPGTSPRLLPDVVLAGHTDQVWHAAFSPDGSRIVTDSWDNTARLWDSEGKQLAVLGGHTAELRRAAFSPDGSRIVTTSDDGTARLWDSEGKQLAVLVGHTAGVFHAEFSPDSSRILTASDDGTARLYRVPATTHNSSTGPAAIDGHQGTAHEGGAKGLPRVMAERNEVVSQQPGPEVTDPTIRRKIEESGQPTTAHVPHRSRLDRAKYEHQLNIKSEDDFKVSGMVSLTIEPRCTFEELPFTISHRSGELTITQ